MSCKTAGFRSTWVFIVEFQMFAWFGCSDVICRNLQLKIDFITETEMYCNLIILQVLYGMDTSQIVRMYKHYQCF